MQIYDLGMLSTHNHSCMCANSWNRIINSRKNIQIDYMLKQILMVLKFGMPVLLHIVKRYRFFAFFLKITNLTENVQLYSLEQNN